MAKLYHLMGNDGVTVFAYYFAHALAQQGRKAMLVSTDSLHQNAHLLLPPLKEDADRKSLGQILSAPTITPSGILSNTMTPKNNSNLGVIAYSPYETDAFYPEISETDVADFFTHLTSLVDYIVVDGTEAGSLTTYAREHAELCFCISSGDEKGLAYRQLLRFRPVRHILFQNNPLNPIEDMRHSTGEAVHSVIPYCKSLRALYNGSYIDSLPQPSRYRKMLTKLVQEVTANAADE